MAASFPLALTFAFLITSFSPDVPFCPEMAALSLASKFMVTRSMVKVELAPISITEGEKLCKLSTPSPLIIVFTLIPKKADFPPSILFSPEISIVKPSIPFSIALELSVSNFTPLIFRIFSLGL